MNLRTIRREAECLEVDVDTSQDFLDLYVRSDRSLYFNSFCSPDDPAALDAAWTWLQDYRRLLASLDQYRAQPPQKRRRRYAIRSIIIWLLVALQCADLWSLYQHRLPTGWCIIAFLILICLFGLMLPNKKRRAIRGK